ncbi:unnamed protein product [Protopolystoma xenopodis]|uniref:Uncharacterized protein n=1 Tax=Protopolystoma xenopodis TaxID=117903 RepID=A0A3S5FEW5_9PLAT|nr:unnamed protein product [Protopolystoma xenopodis]
MWSHRKPKEDCGVWKTVGLCVEVLISPFCDPEETVSRGFLRTIQQSSLRHNPPSVSGETTSRIPSNQLFLRNGVMSQ